MTDTRWHMTPNKPKALMLAKRQLSELVCDAVNLEGYSFHFAGNPDLDRRRHRGRAPNYGPADRPESGGDVADIVQID